MKDSGVNPDGGPARAGSSSTTTAPSLLERLRARDPDAWRRLVALYGPEVYRWCRRAGLNPDDAADVGQEAFRALVIGLGSFRRDRPGDSFRGWLWTIVQNKIRDHWRRQGDRPAALGGSSAQLRLLEIAAEETADPVGEGPEAHSVALVHRALDLVRREFEPRTWHAFWQAAVEGRPAAEVASALGISPGAVYIARSRILRRLREELDGLIPFRES